MAQGPRDLLRFLVPKWSLQFNQESLISRLIIQPLLGLLSNSPKHIRRQASQPTTSENTNIIAQEWLAVLSGDLEPPQESDSCVDTFIKTKLPQKYAPGSGQFYSPACFTLASSKSATPPIWQRDLLQRNQTLHQVVTHHSDIFLLNQRYKTRKLSNSH